MKMLENMWKFTDTDVDVSGSRVYKCMEAIENGDIKEFKKLYKELSQESGNTYNLQQGYYLLMGYKFDFKPFLRRFLVRFRYKNNYDIIYALNKTNIYDYAFISRYNIIDILEDTRHKIEL